MSANSVTVQTKAATAAASIASALADVNSAQAAMTLYEAEGGHLSTTNGRAADVKVRTALLSAAYWINQEALESATWTAGAGSSQFITLASGLTLAPTLGSATVSAGTAPTDPTVFFSETWTGSNGDAWNTGRWSVGLSSGGTATIQNALGQLVTSGVGADDQMVTKHTALADQKVSGSFLLSSATVDEQIAVYIRCDGIVNPNDNGYPNTGFGLVLAPALGQIRFRKSVSGTKAQAVSFTYAFDPAHLTVNYELLAVGTSLEVRVWNDNATRPSSPTFGTPSVSISDVTGAGKIQYAVTNGAGGQVTTLFGAISGTIVSTGGGGTPTPKAFASVWGAYTDTNGSNQQPNHTTFETFIGHQSNTVVLMVDGRKRFNVGSVSISFAANQTSGQWTAANKGTRRFVLFWPCSWIAYKDPVTNAVIDPEQDLLGALSDQAHIDNINSVCVNYLKPVFPQGDGLIIRMPHEWELDYYAWGLTRSANNTPARLIAQVNRQADAFLAQMPNVKFDACSIAGSVPFTGSVQSYQIAAATRYQVLDGIYAHLGSKMMISADNYDTGPQSEQFGDIRNIFDYAVAKGLQVGITETGIQSHGDNGQYPLDSWNNIKAYGQNIDHWCWFDSAQGSTVDRRLEVNPNCRTSVQTLLASG